jgi:hypothetical protein
LGDVILKLNVINHNNKMIRIATEEAFIDLMLNGDNPYDSLRDRAIRQLDLIYGVENNINLTQLDLDRLNDY